MDDRLSFEHLENKCCRDYDQGRYSPLLVSLDQLDLEIQKRCTDETDDADKLKQQRQSVIKSGSVKVTLAFPSLLTSLSHSRRLA